MIFKDDEFRVFSENAFTPELVQTVWGTKYNAPTATPISNTPKPWRN